ncbi:MAG: ABC transporter permease subunit [Thermomicrobiales bacterium]
MLLAIAPFSAARCALTSRSERLGALLVGLVSGARVVPSIAVLFLTYPWRRQLGDLAPFWPASFTLAIVADHLAGPPLLINIDAGLRGVDAGILENARGLGMTEHQVFLGIQAPLALPVAVAGIRIAAIEVIASATIAAFVGAGVGSDDSSPAV